LTEVPAELADLLGLPARARQSRRLTKKDIAAQWEQSAPADARLLNRVIAAATIVGVLSPATVGAAAVKDAERPVDMIPVISMTLVDGVKQVDRTRVAELMHRSMPRPAVLGLRALDGELMLSLALTRLSLTEAEMSVIEAHLLTRADEIATESLHVTRLARSDLAALYRDLVCTAAAEGRPASPALTAAEAVDLRHKISSLETDLAAAARDAARERAMQRKIEINSRARQLREQIERARTSLYAEAGNRSLTNEDPRVGQ